MRTSLYHNMCKNTLNILANQLSREQKKILATIAKIFIIKIMMLLRKLIINLSH